MSAPRGPRAPRPNCRQVGGPRARPRLPGARGGRGRRAPGPGPGQRGRRRHDSGARAAKVRGCAPRRASGPGRGPGHRRPPRSPPRRRPRARGERGERGRGRLSRLLFPRLLGGSARAPAGGSRELPGHAGSGAPGLRRGPPLGSWGQVRTGGPGSRGAREQARATRGRRCGAARVPGAAAPEGAGPLGSPAVQGRWSVGARLGWRAGWGAQNGAHGRSLQACAE